jgi:hypothetical protein
MKIVKMQEGSKKAMERRKQGKEVGLSDSDDEFANNVVDRVEEGEGASRGGGRGVEGRVATPGCQNGLHGLYRLSTIQAVVINRCFDCKITLCEKCRLYEEEKGSPGYPTARGGTRPSRTSCSGGALYVESR